MGWKEGGNKEAGDVSRSESHVAAMLLSPLLLLLSFHAKCQVNSAN